jgi:hypothetical protein
MLVLIVVQMVAILYLEALQQLAAVAVPVTQDIVGLRVVQVAVEMVQTLLVEQAHQAKAMLAEMVRWRLHIIVLVVVVALVQQGLTAILRAMAAQVRLLAYQAHQ